MFINWWLDKGILVHPCSETPLRNKKEQTTDTHNSRDESQEHRAERSQTQRSTQSMTPSGRIITADTEQISLLGAGEGGWQTANGTRRLSGVVEMLYILATVMAIQTYTFAKSHPPVHFTWVCFILGKPHLGKVHFKTSPAARYKLCWPNPEPESSRVRRKWMHRCSRHRPLQLLNSVSQLDIETLGF